MNSPISLALLLCLGIIVETKANMTPAMNKIRKTTKIKKKKVEEKKKAQKVNAKNVSPYLFCVILSYYLL